MVYRGIEHRLATQYVAQARVGARSFLDSAVGIASSYHSLSALNERCEALEELMVHAICAQGMQAFPWKYLPLKPRMRDEVSSLLRPKAIQGTMEDSYFFSFLSTLRQEHSSLKAEHEADSLRDAESVLRLVFKLWKSPSGGAVRFGGERQAVDQLSLALLGSAVQLWGPIFKKAEIDEFSKLSRALLTPDHPVTEPVPWWMWFIAGTVFGLFMK